MQITNIRMENSASESERVSKVLTEIEEENKIISIDRHYDGEDWQLLIM